MSSFLLTHSGKTKSRLALSPPSSASAPCFNSACELNCARKELEGSGWKLSILGGIHVSNICEGLTCPTGGDLSPTALMKLVGESQVIEIQPAKETWNAKSVIGLCKSVKSYNLLQFPGLQKKSIERRFQVQRGSDLAHRCVPFTRSYQERSGAILAQGIHIGLAKPELRGFSKGRENPGIQREPNWENPGIQGKSNWSQSKTSESVNFLFQRLGPLFHHQLPASLCFAVTRHHSHSPVTPAPSWSEETHKPWGKEKSELGSHVSSQSYETLLKNYTIHGFNFAANNASADL